MRLTKGCSAVHSHLVLYAVSKNEPASASCSFDKHCLIWIILGKLHQHTFKNYMHIQVALSLHFCLLYLLLNSCDGNDTKHNVFSSVDYWQLWKEPVPLKRAGFILADVRSYVLSPSCMRITAFSIDQQLRQWHFVICVKMFNEAQLQVAGAARFLLQLF